MKTGKQRFVILLLSVGLMLSGCSGKSAQEQVESGQATEAAHEHGHRRDCPTGISRRRRLRLMSACLLKSQTSELQTIYALSAQVSDVLKYIPCYCGCGDSAGHEQPELFY